MSNNPFVIYHDNELSLDIPLDFEIIKNTKEKYFQIETALGIKPKFDETIAKRTGIPLELTAHYSVTEETYEDLFYELGIEGIKISTNIFENTYCGGITEPNLGIPVIFKQTKKTNMILDYLNSRLIYNHSTDFKLHELIHSQSIKFSDANSFYCNSILFESIARASTEYNLEDIRLIHTDYDDNDTCIDDILKTLKIFHNHNTLADRTNIFEATVISSMYIDVETYNKETSKILNTGTLNYKSYLYEVHNYIRSWPILFQWAIPSPMNLGYLAYAYITQELESKISQKNKSNDFTKFVEEQLSEI